MESMGMKNFENLLDTNTSLSFVSIPLQYHVPQIYLVKC